MKKYILLIFFTIFIVFSLCSCERINKFFNPKKTKEFAPYPLPYPEEQQKPKPAEVETPKIEQIHKNSPDFSYEENLWKQAKIRPQWIIYADKVVQKIYSNKNRYSEIEKMRQNGVPWFIIGGLHERESTMNFSKHLHNGNPLTARTYWVPKGRLPDKDPPYTFEESAEDALYVVDSMHHKHWETIGGSLYAIELYNGFGYRNNHPEVNSPYVYSGTTLYTMGKYVADGKFSSMAVDKQIGIATILLRAKERNLLSEDSPFVQEIFSR